MARIKRHRILVWAVVAIVLAGRERIEEWTTMVRAVVSRWGERVLIRPVRLVVTSRRQ